MYQPLAEKGINGKQSQKWRFWGKAGAFQGQLPGFFLTAEFPPTKNHRQPNQLKLLLIWAKISFV